MADRVKRRPRVALISIDDPLYLPGVFRPLLESAEVEVVQVVLIPVLRAVNMHPGGALGLGALRRRVGLYGPEVALKFALAQGLAATRSLFRGDMTLGGLARQRGVPVARWTGSVNEAELAALIRGRGAQLTVGVFSEKAGPALLGASPRGLLLLHYSRLPAFAGREPAFWTLMEAPAEAGITFFIADERWDGGRVVLRARLDQSGVRTLHQAIARLSALAADCVLESVLIAASGRAGPGREPIAASKRSWPRPEDVRLFRSKGLRFI